MIEAQDEHGPQEEQADAEEVGELALFIWDTLLHPKDSDAVADQRSLFLSVMGDDVNFIAALGERLRIPHYTVIGLIKRVRHHANSHAVSLPYDLDNPGQGLRSSAIAAKHLPLNHSTTILTAPNSRELPNLSALFLESGTIEPAAVTD